MKADLKSRKMVFIGGPRQVGKTTLSQSFLKGKNPEGHPAYLNWDQSNTKSSLIRGEFPSNQKLIILDEIHKYLRWRNLVKGYYDTHKSTVNILVTGSAKLDYYRRGGDSLLGRYHYYRLHPFTVNEYKGPIEHLIEFGGFPEPLLKKDKVFYRRWSRSRLEKIIYEDINSLEAVREVGIIDLLVNALPERVGSPLSVKSLRENLEVAHETVERYLTILERLYLIYRIPPYGSPKIRAVKKEQKLYFWDWASVDDPGARFENLVAGHLLKFCHFIEDTQGHVMELRFLRDIDKREIDFVVIKDKKPLFAVECKTGERNLSPHIKYFKERLPIPKYYQVHLGKKSYSDSETGAMVLPFTEFCKLENIP
jgi:predicted AAA+ superfamily ATPase